jgi:NCAIR mutase (PurE)-related protein
MTYNSYSSDTPSTKHPWHNNSFYDVLDMHQEFMTAEEKKAVERQQRIEEEKVRLRIAKVAQLHSKRVSVNGISEALGICKEQVEEDLDYIERSMNQAIAVHTANVNQEEEEEEIEDLDEYEKARRLFLNTGHYEPKNSGGYIAIFC